MDARPDTASSSGRFRGQWSFLANPPQRAQQPRSLPPSSYILQSDRSSISPLPTGLHYQTVNGSRTSLPRNLTTTSVGGRSVASTAPSQPVLIRVHSADASAHTNPAPRPRRPIKTMKNSGLPAVSEFSIQGILAAIQEDVEQDINTISEILGRSRLVLADQHDSHMPPQGEIRATSTSLDVVEEASPGDEQLAVDDVFILRDDASLVAGSQVGSAAYGLLERLQAIPRTDNTHGDWNVSPFMTNQPPSSFRHRSSFPSIISPDMMEDHSLSNPEPQRTSRNLLQSQSRNPHANRNTLATVSETHLLAGADGSTSLVQSHEDFDSNPFELYETDRNPDRNPDRNADRDRDRDRQIETPDLADVAGYTTNATFRERMQNLLYVSDPTGLSVWLQGQNGGPQQHTATNAEGHLRELLER